MAEGATRSPLSGGSCDGTSPAPGGRVAVAPFEVRTSVDLEGTPLIEVSGEIDLSNVDLLKEAVDRLTGRRPAEVEATRASSPDRLVFDLSDVTFIGSVGLGALVSATDRVGTVVLRKPSSVVRRMVELVGLAPLVRIED